MIRTMENENNRSSLVNMLTDPDNIHRAFEDPTNFGKEIYQALDIKQKQYLAFAAGAGLIAYGIYLGKQK